jgi:hypothetical protein
VQEEKLCNASPKRNYLPFCKKVYKHLRGCDRGVPNVKKGQISQQEIHRISQMRVKPDGANDKDVSWKNEQIEG